MLLPNIVFIRSGSKSLIRQKSELNPLVMVRSICRGIFVGDANVEWVLSLWRARKPYFSRNDRKANHRDTATGLWPDVRLIEADGGVYPEAGRFLADQGSIARHLPLDVDISGGLGCRG